MSLAYFNHDYVSNSDLKGLADELDGIEKPANLEAIFDFGSRFHQGILEPHKIHLTNSDEDCLIREMRDTFLADPLCQKLILTPDFRREHEWYRQDVHGLKAKCKTDGDSKSLSIILELKGIRANTENAFHEAINRFHYDQGDAWYLDTTHLSRHLMVAINKTNPKKLFKCLIDRRHAYYQSGVMKIQKSIRLWKSMSVDGQNLI